MFLQFLTSFLKYFTSKVLFTIFIVMLSTILINAEDLLPKSEVNLNENCSTAKVYTSLPNNVIFTGDANVITNRDAHIYIKDTPQKDTIINIPKRASSIIKNSQKTIAKKARKIILKQNDTLFTIPISNKRFFSFGSENNYLLTIPQLLILHFKKSHFLVCSISETLQKENNYNNFFELKFSYHFIFFSRPPPLNI